MYVCISACGWFILCAFPCLGVSETVRVCDFLCIFMCLHMSVSLRAGDSVCISVFHCRNICIEYTCYVASSDSASLEETLQQEMLWIPASGWNFTQKKYPFLVLPITAAFFVFFSGGWVEGVYANLDLRGYIFQEDLAEPWNSTPCHSPLARPTSSS